MFQDHADREWKFARSKLWMGYFDEGCTLPPPFNLIISPKSIYYFLSRIKNLIQQVCRRRRSGKPRRKSIEGTIKVIEYSLQQSQKYVYNVYLTIHEHDLLYRRYIIAHDSRCRDPKLQKPKQNTVFRFWKALP